MESKETASPRDLTEAPASQLTAQLEKSQVPSNDLFQNSIEHLRVRKPCADSITIPKDTGSSARYATPVQTHFPTYKDELRPLNLPATPVKGDRPGQGLTLQVPQRVVNAPSNPFNRVPASPKVDAVQTYTSPSSVLPRRSRGLDFSRASTNLHHSTLAEASPDSSPVVGGRGVTIPHRRSIHGCVNASPSNSHGHMWSASGYNERNMISSSVSSINLLDSESSSCSDEDADASPNVPEGVESAAVIPQLAKTVQDPTNTLKPSLMQRPTTEWMHNASISKPSLMNFQRARYRGRTRHSSTSTSANSSGASPGPRSPSMAKSIETFPSGYFSNEVMVGDVRSRRESLSLGTSDLQLSDMSDEESKQGGNNSFNGATNPELTRRGVIRRAVTRRGNLLVSISPMVITTVLGLNH